MCKCLQDEMEELRSEMLEMRDMYMEDDVYQLQELRQQLEQVRPLANRAGEGLQSTSLLQLKQRCSVYVAVRCSKPNAVSVLPGK